MTAADTRPRIILVERRRGAQGRYGDIVDSSPNSIMAEPLGGRYQLGDVIGRGGMASVYTAKDLNLGRDVALKLFAPQSADPDELRRQEAEIELLATLNHPSLVTLFDAGTDTRIPNEPRPFLTMELVDGQDLRTRIRHSPLPLDELAVVGAGIADALAYVHGLGIVHRDIKPANILLVPVRPGEPLRPKLTDFGIARIIDGTRLTATGTMVGTAAYLSPEQARGADLGPASDIYSLGLVLLECLKGQVEYPGSAVESAVARLHRAPAIPAEVPAEWARLIRAMTALDPLDRPSAAELEAALRYALVSPGSLPGPIKEDHTRVLPSPPARPARPPRPGAAPGTGALGTTGTRPLNLLDPAAVPPRPRRRPSLSRGTAWFRRAGLRTRVALVLAVVAVLAVGAVIAVALSTPAPVDVVPYPTVTGPLGDHLKDLQKSVEP
ncbi:serine/threonine protein kinase [Arthrobacter sp. TE12232]